MRYVALASLLLATSVAAGDKVSRKGSWDELSKQVIPKIVTKTEDFASIVRQVRRVSCTIELTVATSVSRIPMSAEMSYAWEDKNDSGTITGDEIEIETLSSSAPAMAPALRELRRELEKQTVMSVGNIFPLNNVQTVKTDTGYKMRLQPLPDSGIAEGLGYSVCYLTLSEDFRLETIRAKDDQGGEATAKLKYMRHGDKWLTAGYHRIMKGGNSEVEEERTNEYADFQGVPLVTRVLVNSTISVPNGTITSETQLLMRNWQIEKRPKPLQEEEEWPAGGGGGTGGGKPDDDESLFGKPPADQPGGGTGGTPGGAGGAGGGTGGPPATPPTPLAVAKFRAGPVLQVLDEAGKLHPSYAVAFSPDGRQVAATDDISTLRFWDAATGQCGKVIRLKDQGEPGLAWSPDGRRIVTKTLMGDLQVWDVATGNAVAQLKGKPPMIPGSVVWSPDGTRIAAGSMDGFVHFWDGATLEPLPKLRADGITVFDVAYTPWSPRFSKAQVRFVTGGDGNVRVWDAEAWTQLSGAEVEGHMLAVALSWNAAKVAFAPQESTQVLVYGALTGTAYKPLAGHTGAVEALAFCPSAGSSTLASGSADKTVRLWNYLEGTCLQVLEGHTGVVRDVAFDPEGVRIVSAGEDGTVRIWVSE